MADFKTDAEGYLLDEDGKRQMLLGYPVVVVPAEVECFDVAVLIEEQSEAVED